MKPSSRVARRGSALAASLGLSERLLSSATDRAMARRIDDGLDRIESSLLEEIKFTGPVEDAAARYLFQAGGKRVRPLLTLLAAQLGDGTTDEVITAAQAIEITHLASLYHDDVMDDADRRRGVPSAHSIWGNSVAILTGDLLFARASQLMARLGERAIRMQADTFERLVLGQLHESVGPQPGEDPVTHYIQVLSDKTGSLIAVSAQAGVIFSNSPPEYERPLIEFGEKVGVAFQLIDDVIDLSPQPEATGKAPGTDLRAGVMTLPLILLREKAKHDSASADLFSRIERQAMQVNNEGADHSANELVAELRAHEATSQTLREAKNWAKKAKAAIAPLPEGGVKKALSQFADAVVERSN